MKRRNGKRYDNPRQVRLVFRGRRDKRGEQGAVCVECGVKVTVDLRRWCENCSPYVKALRERMRLCDDPAVRRAVEEDEA